MELIEPTFNTFIFSNKFINKIFQPGRKNDH